MNFASTTLYTVTQTVIKMLAGFVVIKVVASLGGPEGVSSLGVIQNLNLIYVMLCGGIMATGITKGIATNGFNQHLFVTFNTIKHLELKLSIMATCIIVVIISMLLLSSYYEYSKIILVIVTSLTLTFFHSKVLIYLAQLNGFLKIKELACLNIMAAIFSIVVSTVLYYFYPVWELVVITLPLGYVFVYLFSKKEMNRFYRHCEVGESLNVGNDLRKFAIFGLVSAICLPVSQLIIRTYIANNVSIYDSGIWQAVVRLSEVYLVLISSALSVFLVPKISNMSDGARIKCLVIKFISIVSIVSIVGMTFVFFIRDYLIFLLFDESFSEMSPLFIYQLPGDFFKILSWVFAFSMLGLGSVKKMLILELVFSFTYIVLSISGVKAFGVEGAIAAYSVNYFIYFTAIAILFGVEIGKYKQKLP